MSPTKSELQSNYIDTLPNTESAVNEKYIVQQFPIPSHSSSSSYELSPLDLYKKMNLNVKESPISYEYNDYKYNNYHQQNSQNSNSKLNHVIAALVVDKNKNQSQNKPKPYYYNPPEIKRKYSGNQIRDVSNFNNQFRI